ncbi:MAG: hypothetical protein IK093_10080 [Ruminiclostridium sp.]|nr:hypothetical protein [Ruminiclostridium sp.]
MEKYIEELENVFSKKNLNKTDVETAVQALNDLRQATDIQNTVTYLIRCKADIWPQFFERIENFSDIETYLCEIENHEVFSKKGNNYIYLRLFAMVYILLKKDYMPTELSQLVVKVIKYGEKQNGAKNGADYAIELKKAYQKYIIDKKISDKFWLLKENATEKNYFNRFREAIEKQDSKPEQEQPEKQPQIEKEPEQKNDAGVVTNKPENEAPPMESSQVLDMVSLSHAQLESLLKNNFEKVFSELSDISHKVIDNYRSALSSKDSEITHLKDENKNIRDRIVALRTELSDTQQENEELKSLVDSLKEKLSLAYKIDNAAQNQELLALKKNVSDSIRPEFEDFNSSGREFNEDNFLANCASIERIFKILKRFGFDL